MISNDKGRKGFSVLLPLLMLPGVASGKGLFPVAQCLYPGRVRAVPTHGDGYRVSNRAAKNDHSRRGLCLWVDRVPVDEHSLLEPVHINRTAR